MARVLDTTGVMDGPAKKVSSPIDFVGIKDHASGRCIDIITLLTPLPSSVAEKGNQDHPCPICGGDSVAWPDTRDGGVNEHGRIACRNCTDGKPTSDIVGTIFRFGNFANQADAARAIANVIGMPMNLAIVPRKFTEAEAIDEVCKRKRMPVDAFMKFGPKLATRNGKQVVRVPLFDANREPVSHFDLFPRPIPASENPERHAAESKGLNAPGKSAGIFIGPDFGPGDTVVVVEGCKDAAALVGLGFIAIGTNGSSLKASFAPMLQGANVIIVHDLDKAGLKGAKQTASRLDGIAADIRIARLPGEMKPKHGDDVRDVLRRLGPDAVKKAISEAHVYDPLSDDEDDRHSVVIEKRFDRHCREVTRRLGESRTDDGLPTIFERGGMLTEIVRDKEGVPKIRIVPREQIPLRITQCCRLIEEKELKGEILERDIVPPRWLVDGIHTAGGYDDMVEHLSGVVTTPTMRPDGSILQESGYDEVTGLIFEPSCDYPVIADSPSIDDAKAAAKKLLALVDDFPFATPADRSAWLSLLLTMIARSAIRGPVPISGVTANSPGSGKTMAVDLAEIIVRGRTMPRISAPSVDDEMRKLLTSLVVENAPAAMFDNIRGSFGGPAIEAATTGEIWRDRELKSSRTIELPVRTVFVATGNNLRFKDDTTRRVVLIRLRTDLESPEERTDFRIPNLQEHVTRHRAEYVVAALTILKGFVSAGMPTQPGKTMGSFGEWANLICGAIRWVGLADPLGNRDAMNEDDESRTILRGLILGLEEINEGETEKRDGNTAREIADKLNTRHPSDFPAMRDIVSEVAMKNGIVDARILGNQLKKFRGRILDGRTIEMKPGRARSNSWLVKAVGGECGESDGESAPDIIHHENTNVLPGETAIGECGESYSEPYAYRNKTLNERDVTRNRDQPRSDSPHTPHSPPVFCDRCGAEMTAAPEINGFRNFDCKNCEFVKPVKVGEATK